MAAALIATSGTPRPIRLARLTTERLNLSLPVDVDRVARAAGITIRERSLESAVDGLLAYSRDKDRWAIITNSRYRDRHRRRFTIAHELGHFMLHRQLILAAGPEGITETPVMEWEASQYAAELLMPAEQALWMYRSGCVPYEIHNLFGVSMSAWYRRLADLGIHVHPAYR
jgi:Zn-dependent peptidase ImmA (M78 family)